MIIDQIENWKIYLPSLAWQKVFQFLDSCTPALEEGRYHIEGDDIFALVMSYQTRSPEEAILESHQEYIDIQTVFAATEGCEYYPVAQLTVAEPYDKEKDAAFYHRPSPCPAYLRITPGTFVAFFPQDAHMPTLMVDGQSQTIKKVVVKARTSLLTP